MAPLARHPRISFPQLNPRNIDAVREVRLHGMRGAKRTPSNPPPPPPTEGAGSPKGEDGKPGLFGRLFKKP